MKKYHPTSPARRQMEVIDYRSVITRVPPHKSLVSGFQRHVGRNSAGRITTRHKGSGAKRLWREIDFVYDKKDIPAKTVSIEYDPNRTSFIALVQYKDGEKRYVLAPHGLKIGQEMIVSERAPIEIGNRVVLKTVPVGTAVYNVELQRGHGAQLGRAAGASAIVAGQEEHYTHVQLPSKEVRMVRNDN